MLHLLDRDPQDCRCIRIAVARQFLIFRLKRERSIQVLKHQRVLDFSSLPQEAQQFEIRIREVADDPHLALGGG
jgi:hypothetical protein